MKTSALLLVGAYGLTWVVPAFGGAKQNAQTVVFSNGAQGEMGAARNSSDSTQILGCYLEGDTSGTPTITVECFATDASGNSIACESTSPVLVQAVQGITSDSWINFTVTAVGSGICQNIVIKTASYTPPKTL